MRKEEEVTKKEEVKIDSKAKEAHRIKRELVGSVMDEWYQRSYCMRNKNLTSKILSLHVHFHQIIVSLILIFLFFSCT